jgi:cyclopropane fatty-acyl-phospholipid synthase-like methyltransferase
MITLYEPLGLSKGHKLLEIGLGSGYSAAVACETVGEDGLVVCIEIDPAVFEEGRRYVERSGVKNVILVLGDGGLGYPEKAPYDRICITAACTEVLFNLQRYVVFWESLRAWFIGRGQSLADLVTGIATLTRDDRKHFLPFSTRKLKFN